MSKSLDPADMKDYVEHWSPAMESTMTTNGMLVEMGPRASTTEISALFENHSWVVDQIHWETRTFHMVPEEVLNDE